MPPSFQALFPNARVLIDASEIECDRPKLVEHRVLFYSNYKSRFTVKFLIGVAPSGDIMFISKISGGRMTDTQLTVSSGLLNYLEPGIIWVF
jgi:hypothetical protein